MKKDFLVALKYFGFQFSFFVIFYELKSWIEMDRIDDDLSWQISNWFEPIPTLSYLKTCAIFSALFIAILIIVQRYKRSNFPSIIAIAFIAAMSTFLYFSNRFRFVQSDALIFLIPISHSVSWGLYLGVLIVRKVGRRLSKKIFLRN